MIYRENSSGNTSFNWWAICRVMVEVMIHVLRVVLMWIVGSGTNEGKWNWCFRHTISCKPQAVIWGEMDAQELCDDHQMSATTRRKQEEECQQWIVSNKQQWIVANKQEWIFANKQQWIVSNKQQWIVANKQQWIVANTRGWIVANKQEWSVANKQQCIVANKQQ